MRVLALVALLLIAGCGTSRYSTFSETEFPAAEVARLESSPHPAGIKKPGRWIRLDLTTVYALAGAHDLEIARARERLELQRARESEALFGFIPVLRPNAHFAIHEGEYMDTTGRFVDVTRQQTLAGARATLELELGEALIAVRVAEARVRAGEADLEAARHERLLVGATLYYRLVATVQAIGIAREALTSSEELLRYHTSRLERGVGLNLAVERSKARVEADKLAIADAEVAYRATSSQLSVQLRLDPRHLLHPAETALVPSTFFVEGADVEALVRTAVSRHPGLLAASERMNAAQERVDGEAWSWLVPTLTLDGALDERGENPNRFGGSGAAFVGLEWRLSLGHAARRRASAARRHIAAAEWLAMRERLIGNVVTMTAEIGLGRQRIAGSERRIIAARAAMNFAESRMRAGAGLLLEVLDARVELTQAQLARLRAVTDHNTNQVALFVLTGSSPDGSFPAESDE